VRGGCHRKTNRLKRKLLKEKLLSSKRIIKVIGILRLFYFQSYSGFKGFRERFERQGLERFSGF